MARWIKAAFACSVVSLCVCGRAALADEPAAREAAPAARMVRLDPSPLLLQPPDGLTGEFAVAQETPATDFAVYPGQWEGAELWSAWGDCVCGPDGRFYASIGDHGGPHGTSYVYSVDPVSKEVSRVVDYNEVVGRPKERYTPGKIHAPICDGGDGWLYLVGYRGSVQTTTQEADFAGDWLLRYHVESGKVENLGILVPNSSVPEMVAYRPGRMLYGLAAPGKTMPEPRNQFFAYSLDKRELVFVGGPESAANRTIIVTADGRVYYDSEGVFVRYDPREGTVTKTAVPVPGDGVLRAASRPDRNGVVYGFSSDGVAFAFDPRTEQVTELMKGFVTEPLYTATCALSPDDRYLYYVPSAHGGSRSHGTALIQLDVRTRRRKVIAFLNQYLRQEQNYNLGGTYGLALSGDGSMLFVNWNGGPADQLRNDFGLCAAMIVRIPEAERRAE